MNKETTEGLGNQARLKCLKHQKYKCPNCNEVLLQNQLVPTLYMCKKCYESKDYKLAFFDEKQLKK